MHRNVRTVLGAAVLPLALLAGAAGPALADRITGTPGDDILPAMPRRDIIRGLAGDDDITPGGGDDRAFGDEGADAFHWNNGDGHDRLDGGSGPGSAEFERDSLGMGNAGRRLRLHLDAIGAGPETVARDERQVVGLRRIERIAIGGTAGRDRLVFSSDRDIPGLRGAIGISTGAGNDLVDARDVPVAVYVSPGSGNDEIRLGRGSNIVFWEFEAPEFGHDRISGFGDDDSLELGEPHPFCRPAYLDTNGDGKLTAKDRTVKVVGGSMTIDLTAGTIVAAEGSIKVTLAGRTSLPVARVVVLSNC